RAKTCWTRLRNLWLPDAITRCAALAPSRWRACLDATAPSESNQGLSVRRGVSRRIGFRRIVLLNFLEYLEQVLLGNEPLQFHNLTWSERNEPIAHGSAPFHETGCGLTKRAPWQFNMRWRWRAGKRRRYC